MRGGRSFLVLLVIALGLGAYIFFVESKREPSDSAFPKKDKVFTTDTTTLDELQIHAASGESTTLRKKNGIWEIAEPQALDADSSEVGGLISTIESLEIQNVVDEQPESAAPFGLDPPRFTVAFKAAGSTDLTRLEVGRKTPTGSDLYARVGGQSRVFLISAYLEDSLNKTTFNLRDKTALKFERDAADSLTIDRAGEPTVAFTKKGSDWRFTRPYDAKADFTGVDGIVGRLYSARMSAIVADDGTTDLKKYGLDKPQATAVVGTGSARATLALGAKTDDGSLYARDLSRPMVFKVDATLLDDLTKKADDLRRKDLFEFRSYSALKVEATLGGRSITLEKQKAPEPTPGSEPSTAPAEVWKQTRPEARDIDQAKVTDLLTTMSNLRAESFATSALTGGEELVFTVTFGDASSPVTEVVRFRKSGTTVHATLAGDTGAAVVNTADYDRALGLLKDILGAP